MQTSAISFLITLNIKTDNLPVLQPTKIFVLTIFHVSEIRLYLCFTLHPRVTKIYTISNLQKLKKKPIGPIIYWYDKNQRWT